MPPTPAPPLLTTLVGRLAEAVPRRARTTFTELLLGAAATRGGHVTDAILAAGLSRGWTTCYRFPRKTVCPLPVRSDPDQRRCSPVAGRVVRAPPHHRRANHGRDEGSVRRDRCREAAQRGGGRRRRARRRGPVPRRGGRVGRKHAPPGGEAGRQVRAAALLLRGRSNGPRAAETYPRPRPVVR